MKTNIHKQLKWIMPPSEAYLFAHSDEKHYQYGICLFGYDAFIAFSHETSYLIVSKKLSECFAAIEKDWEEKNGQKEKDQETS